MKTCLFNFLLLSVCSASIATAQVNLNNNKSSNLYRGQIMAAGSSSFEIRKGTLWAWGFNSDGQLGNGTTTNKNKPTHIGIATNWFTIAGGNAHTIALKSDGTLWAWGFNANGELGDGTTKDRHSPIQIASPTNWLTVACGNKHVLALKSDGTLWAWGRNSDGQLGDGTTIDKSTPTQIGRATNWVSIAG